MNEIDNSQILIGKHIYEASKNNDLVVFVGAGVSANSGVPNWEQLIKQLKNDLPESMDNEQDYLKVAELYRTVSASEDDYLKSISKHLRCNETHFNPIHKAILRLNPSHIITTNFDNLLEEACADSKVHYSVIRTDKQVPQAMYSRYLIKMHGDFESGKIVLTETDYYNYASEFPLIDVLVKSLFASKTVLFVGFSFNDLNLKVILNKVQSVLGKDAKPIYLLEDFEREPLLIKYLKKKGVNPFWLPQEIVDKFGDDAPEELIINKGREVYRQLSCLKNDVSKSVDILHELHSYAESVENYMPFFYVSRLNKIVSDMTCRWSITGRGIQLESDSLNNIVEQCKTRSGLRRFLELRGEEYHSLIRTAVNNRILSFGEIQLLKIKEFRRCWEKSDKIDEGCSMFLDFDFRALKKRIKELEGREITYSHRDLELPFIKWMLGDIISAFDLYESLEKHYWDNNKAFLYFICVFNKASIFKGTITISDRDSLDKIEHMEEVVKGIDMLSVLSGLTIDARIKANLLDLINNQYYIDAFSHVNQLMNCILEARSRSERGGYTRNSNIESLSWEICRSFDYSLLNYLITTNSLSAYETYRNGIIGLLNAHFIRGTRANNGFISSRLDAIGAGHIKLMLFAIKADDLIRVFDFYSIKSLLLDSSACEYLQRVIDNVSRDHNTIKYLFKENLLVDKLKSIIFIYWTQHRDNHWPRSVLWLLQSNFCKHSQQRDKHRQLFVLWLFQSHFRQSRS